MADVVIKKGLDLPIVGEATGELVVLEPPKTVAWRPTEFRGFTPKVLAKAGQIVSKGSVVVVHKSDTRFVLRSPVAGVVREVRRGARRVITDYVIEASGDDVESLTKWEMSTLASINREDALEAALATGHWCALRSRPLDSIADPSVVPQAVLICGTETGPLQPGAAALLSGDDLDALQAAVHVLSALTDGAVHLTTMRGVAHAALDQVVGVERHTFSGPHPAGDATVQVNHIEPPAQGGVVWTIRAWDAVALGRTLLDGAFCADRVMAVVGAGAAEQRFVRTVIGAPVQHILGDVACSSRLICGSVLSGSTVDADGWMTYGARALHALPDTVERTLFGWAVPRLGTWSFHKAFLKGFLPTAPQDLRPGLYGGHRAIVPIGHYRDVVATPDIYPAFLFKSMFAGDLEASIELGMLDLSVEEAALCSFICPSKIDFCGLLDAGLARYEQEA